MTALPATNCGEFHVNAPFSVVFPLFTAEGERSWAPSWDPEILSGSHERGSVFRTHDANGRDAVWIVSDYRPDEGRVSYARLAIESNIRLVDVHCRPSAMGGMIVTVRYTLTPLSTEARDFVAAFSGEDRYESMIQEWRSAVAAALSKTRQSQ